MMVKETTVFFTIARARAYEHQTVCFSVKKVSKEIKVNLSISKMNLLTKEPQEECWQEVQAICN